MCSASDWPGTCFQPSAISLDESHLRVYTPNMEKETSRTAQQQLMEIEQQCLGLLTRQVALLVLDSTTLARNLKPLEQQGLVRIEPGEDRRVRLIRLTEPGYTLLQQALPSWEKAQAEMMTRLGPARWDALHADLHHLVAQVP